MSIKTDSARLPHWMKVPLPHGRDYSKVKNLVLQNGLNTICSSGNCPNKGECWSAGTATFMILGDRCTRNCRFCYVDAIKPDLPPSELHTRLVEYVRPEVFLKYRDVGLKKGFRHVESGPLVRSSYHAERHLAGG